MSKAGNTTMKICFTSTHNMSNLTYKFISAFMWFVFMFVVHVSAVYTEQDATEHTLRRRGCETN